MLIVDTYHNFPNRSHDRLLSVGNGVVFVGCGGFKLTLGVLEM